MFKKIRRILRTLAYVTPKQFVYRFKYLLTPVNSLELKNYDGDSPEPIHCLPIPPSKKIIEKTESGYRVTVLNLSKTYENQVDWTDYTYGQLWNYHLQYADFLKQDDLSLGEREKLVLDLYGWLTSGKLKPEPYPASQRIMNLIRFLSNNQGSLDKENELIDRLHSELHFMVNRLEFHLLGNHLMENAFALLMGGTYFLNERWKKIAMKIFSEQIPEQILSDGGHFERSPMYHLIILFRFLEALYYLPKNSDLYSPFLEASKKMLGWIDKMSYRNGDVAHFNDSIDNQAYSRKQILEMAEECGITEYPSSTLKDSGYRKLSNENFELIADACGIKPDSQPGHAHADSLSFVLYVNSEPVIVDPAVSTYEANERRFWERSTEAHNTVTFQQQNTADVWGKFRVASRPDVKILNESDSKIDIHLNYLLQSGDNFEHQRGFFCNKNFIEISDALNLTETVEGRLHFHPTIKIQELNGNSVILENGIKIEFQNIFHLQKFTYKCSIAFNLRTESIGILYKFEKNASLRIILPST